MSLLEKALLIFAILIEEALITPIELVMISDLGLIYQYAFVIFKIWMFIFVPLILLKYAKDN